MSVEQPVEPERIRFNSETTDESKALPKESPSEILSEATLKFAEVGEYLASYVKNQIDRAKLTARDLVGWIVLTCLAVLLAGSVLLTAVAFLFYGVALGLTQIFGGRDWAGYLTTGGGLLLILALTLKLERRAQKRKALKKRVKEYEKQLKRQTETFGHNALERAAAAA